MKSAIDFDKIYQSKNYGEYKILREIEPKKYKNGISRMVEVIFLQTGTTVQTKLSTAIGSKEIKDVYYPKIYGVACIGHSHMVYVKLYKTWNDMINRCYNPNNKSYKNYGSIGVTVCDEWLCYENFIRDAYTLDGFNEYINNDGWQLDKDILQKGIPDSEKVYSKDTCCFVSMRDNNIEIFTRNKPDDKFIGVKQVAPDRFTAKITYNGQEQYLGTFVAPQYAAAIFDYYSRLYYGKPINNLDNISVVDAIAHKINNNVIMVKNIMCKLIPDEL